MFFNEFISHIQDTREVINFEIKKKVLMSSCSSTHSDGDDASCCFQKIQVSGPEEREKNVKQMSSWVCKHSQTPPRHHVERKEHKF